MYNEINGVIKNYREKKKIMKMIDFIPLKMSLNNQ